MGGTRSAAGGWAVLAAIFEFDAEQVAGEVLTDLEGLSVEDLWDRSGRTSRGYVDPHEETWIMVEEVLRPHLDRIQQYMNSKREEEASEYCFAVLDASAGSASSITLVRD